MLHVLDAMGAYEAVIRNDLERYTPFLATTTLLMESVQQGAGREQAHEANKEHAVNVALEMREKGLTNNDLADRIAADERIPLSTKMIDNILRQSQKFVGMATYQVDVFSQHVEELGNSYPDASQIDKERLL